MTIEELQIEISKIDSVREKIIDYSLNYIPLNPYDRIIFILKELIDNEPNLSYLDKIKWECNKAFTRLNIKYSIFDDNDNLIGYSEKDPKSYDLINAEIIIERILNSYHNKILDNLYNSINIILFDYNFNAHQQTIKPIISDNLIFPISILIFQFDTWKELVNYELEIIEKKEERELLIRKFIMLINDLKFRLGYNICPSIQIKLSKSDNGTPIINPAIYSYSIDLRNYINYLQEIDLTKISKSSNIRLTNYLESIKVNFKKIKILSPFSFENILIYFKKIRFTDLDSLKVKSFISNYFETDTYFEKSQIFSKTFSKNDFLLFVLLLKHLKKTKIISTSDRNLSLCIEQHFNSFRSSEMIRNLLSQKNEEQLKTKDLLKIDYYTSSIVTQNEIIKKKKHLN